MIWRERNLLIVLLFSGFVLSEDDLEQPTIKRSFFANRRGETSSFQGTGFNNGGFGASFKRTPVLNVNKESERTEELESALKHEFEDSPRPVQLNEAPRRDDSVSRYRPEAELEHSTQVRNYEKAFHLEEAKAGQVAETLIKDSLAGQIRESLAERSRTTGHSRTGPPTRPEGHNPTGIRSKLIRPLVPHHRTNTVEDNARDNHREPARSQSSKGRRIIFPP